MLIKVYAFESVLANDDVMHEIFHVGIYPSDFDHNSDFLSYVARDNFKCYKNKEDMGK